MKTLNHFSLLAYSFFGLPLALVALPIYVYVPQFYVDRFGLTLTNIGAVLLFARMIDAFIDPIIGIWVDSIKNHTAYIKPILIAIAPLLFGFIALFHPPAFTNTMPLMWFTAALMLVYSGFSIASISHQSWGAALTTAPGDRSRLTATREACGLAGVVLAAILPELFGLNWLSALFVLTLLLSTIILWRYAPRPDQTTKVAQEVLSIRTLLAPFYKSQFRWLFAIFIVNGIAAAIPATLFLFFARDQLQLAQYAGLFLVLYFVTAAVSMPFWVVLSRRLGDARAWLVGMLLAIASFAAAYNLGTGALYAFTAICVMSGFALGADLALPPAILAGVLAKVGHSGQHEGTYFGIWNWATKMNLALAAGISLPLLEMLGYVPGTHTGNGLQALSFAYALIPCFLKMIAATILWRSTLHDV